MATYLPLGFYELRLYPAPPCVPTLLFGPFGTGKTRVLVELIRQVLAASAQARILVCTPSNSAANLYVRHLARAQFSAEVGLLRMRPPGVP